jgi:hypothetical protein
MKKVLADTDLLVVIIGGFVLLAVGAFLYFGRPKPTTVVQQFQRPPATNAYIPDPDINSPSYQQRVRQEYEKYTKLETHPYNDFGDIWNVSNIHPTYEKYLQKKYFF